MLQGSSSLIPCSVGSFGLVPERGNVTTLLVLPALCRSSGPGCAVHPHPACPRLGEQPRDAGDWLRPGQVGFAPVGSYSWGAPLLRAQPHIWPQHCLVLALSVLLCQHCWVSPRTPHPHPAPRGSSRDRDRGTEGSPQSSSSSHRGALSPLAVVQEQSILLLRVN